MEAQVKKIDFTGQNIYAGFVPVLKLSRCNEFVTISEICQSSKSRQIGRICQGSVILLTVGVWLGFVKLNLVALLNRRIFLIWSLK